MVLRSFLLWLFLFSKLMVFCQQMQFENISSNLALPSQESYIVKQDSKGYIWFSTEQGLCRYNGEKLLVYNEKNGLPEKAVYAIEEDTQGKIWLLTSAARILYIEKGKIKESVFSKKFQAGSKGKIPYALKFVNDHTIYISLVSSSSFVADTRTNTCSETNLEENVYDYSVNLVNQRLVPWTGNIPDTTRMRPGIPSRLKFFKDGKLERSISLPLEKQPARSLFLLTCSKDSIHYVSFNKHILELKPRGAKIYTLPASIISLYVDRQGSLWAGTLQKGVFYYAGANLDGRAINSLRDYSVGNVMQDAENNIWCATLEKGLFFCKDKNVLNYSFEHMQQTPEMLTSINGTVYMGWHNNIFALTTDTIHPYRLDVHVSEQITDMVEFNNKYYIGSFGFILETDKHLRNARTVTNSRWPHKSSSKQLKVKNGKLYSMIGPYIGEIVNGTCNDHKPGSPMLVGRCFEPLGLNRFLFGTRQGIKMVKVVNDTSIFETIPGITQSVSDIFIDKNRQILVATKGEGLFLYKGKKMVPVNQKFRLPARILFDIEQDRLGRYWIAANTGLFCCVPTGDSIRTISYTTLNGLPANETHKLAMTHDRIFFSNIYGVSSLPLDTEIKTTTGPRIYLNGLTIRERNIDPENLPAELSASDNTLKFYFDVLSFKNNQHHMVYRLRGRDEKFVHANTTQLVMENLSPGLYELEVFAIDENGTKSTQPFRYRFYIAKPFWWTWWFISLMIGLMVLVFIFILRKFVHRAQQRSDEKNRINTILAESQLTAIQAQMNPHFVFNAINSIQKYILKNQKEEAYDYLAKFSHLIRMVLNNSQKKLLPLNKELEILALYVELEQLRFKKAFTFEVQVQEPIDEHAVLVPPMLVQPLLENAIWHGLMPLDKNKTGKLILRFSLENNLLMVVIEDNGIGRAQSHKNKMNLDHHSMALGLVKDRIKMVKQLYQAMEEASMDIVDLVDANGMPAGTRIEIYLPVL